jgi:hypothetical protein
LMSLIDMEKYILLLVLAVSIMQVSESCIH